MDPNPLDPMPEIIHSPDPPNLLESRDVEFPMLGSHPLCPPSESRTAEAPKDAWRKTLFPDMRPNQKFKLRFIPPIKRDEKMFGVCQKNAVEGELVILDLTLVGFFLGRRPSFSFVKAALLRQWKLHGNVEILQLLHGGYAFRFSDIRDRDNILDGDVFFVGGQPMFIRHWERSLHTGGILGLRNVPLWVSLPGLPLHLWGEEALSSICSVLGNPLYSDKNTAMKTRLVFARVCVEFMGDKPLLESINIEDELGMQYEQKVTYDWKPPHCLTCGVFGHEDCGIKAKEMEMDIEKNGKLPDSWDKVLTMKHGPNMENHSPQPGLNLPAAACNSIDHDLLSEKEDDGGWQTVRARKMKSGGSGSGAPFSGQNRPSSQGVRERERLVSTSHWLAQKQAAGQVSQPESCLKKDGFLNSKTCPTLVPGPPSSSKKADLGKDPASPHFEPLVYSKNYGHMGSGLASPKTSAGHTPFPNRLATMARELRRRQSGPHGLSNMLGSKVSDDTAAGDANRTPNAVPDKELGNETYRPVFQRNMDSMYAGQNGNIMECAVDYQRHDNDEMNNVEGQEDWDITRGTRNNDSIADLMGRESDLKNTELHAKKKTSMRSINGGDSTSADMGQRWAQT